MNCWHPFHCSLFVPNLRHTLCFRTVDVTRTDLHWNMEFLNCNLHWTVMTEVWLCGWTWSGLYGDGSGYTARDGWLDGTQVSQEVRDISVLKAAYEYIIQLMDWLLWWLSGDCTWISVRTCMKKCRCCFSVFFGFFSNFLFFLSLIPISIFCFTHLDSSHI